jgi:hypothetical protein
VSVATVEAPGNKSDTDLESHCREIGRVSVVAAVYGPARVATFGTARLFSTASGDDVEVSGAGSSNCFDVASRKKREIVHQAFYIGCWERISDRCSRHSTQSASEPLKMMKRQMYGRANFDLLRRRILLVA